MTGLRSLRLCFNELDGGVVERTMLELAEISD
jgi:hypothetical protein